MNNPFNHHKFARFMGTLLKSLQRQFANCLSMKTMLWIVGALLILLNFPVCAFADAPKESGSLTWYQIGFFASLGILILLIFLFTLINRLKGLAWSFYSILGISLSVCGAAWMGAPEPLISGLPEQVSGEFDFGRIQSTIEKFSSYQSRVSGYQGSEDTAAYIESELRAAGLNDIEIQEFDVASPMVDRATMDWETSSGARSLTLHPIWPNMARTSQLPPEGISGPLVDLGKGRDADLVGKTIRDSISVMDWDQNAEWLSVPEFGGKAIIFRAGDDGGFIAVRNKFLSIPANVPRFYVSYQDLPALNEAIAAGASVTLHCDMEWRRVKSKNIFVKISDGNPQIQASPEMSLPVIFHAYYDSMSVTPSLAPGAEQACSPAVLLELARVFSKVSYKSHRPVYLLFMGAHGARMAGMTHFTRVLHDGLADGWKPEQANSLLAKMGKPGLFVGLDLSTHSDRMGVFCVGSFRAQHGHILRPKFSKLGLTLAQFAKTKTSLNTEADTRASFIDCINPPVDGRDWWTYFPYRAPFASELPTIAGMPGITLSTISDDRRYVDSADDFYARLDFDRFKQQIMHEQDRRVGLVNLALQLAYWQGPFLSSKLEDHLARISGRVLWLDQEKDFTPQQPFVNATVFLKMMRVDKHLLGVRPVPELTDEKGRFTLDGLVDSTPNGNLEFALCMLEAYGVASNFFMNANQPAIQEYLNVRYKDSPVTHTVVKDGSILYAMDQARPAEYPFTLNLLKRDEHLNLVCFPCKAITLYGLTEPRTYQGLREVQILDAATQSPPFQYGSSATDLAGGNSDENCITIWANPNLKIRITMGFGTQEKRLVLVNSTLDNPVGDAFVLNELEHITSMRIRGAMDMWNLDQSRIDRFSKYGISNPRVEALHSEATDLIKRAQTSLDQRDYSGYRVFSEQGWGLESKAYGELLVMANDMIRGVLFYLALLLPFSYCLERLLFASGTIRRRIILMSLIFFVSFIILALIHPAFRFTLTPAIVLLAFVVLALAVTVSLLVLGKLDAFLQERKTAVAGQHEDAQSMAGIAVRAIDLGIANIRRRRMRAFLTGMTIVLVTFTLLSFTSLVPEVGTSQLKHPKGETVYRGLLARNRQWNPLPGPLYDSLYRTFEQDRITSASTLNLDTQAVVAPRAWYYSDGAGMATRIDLVPLKPDTPYFSVSSLLGMDPAERQITAVEGTLIAGRWFVDRDETSVILPSKVAAALKIGPDQLGTQILVFGQRVPVIGIYDEKKFDTLIDIDGEPLTPVNFQQQLLKEVGSLKSPEESDTINDYIHYQSDSIAIVPVRFALRFNATYRSVAVRTANLLDPTVAAEDYARRTNLPILASDGVKDVRLYSMRGYSKLNAAGQILIPILLGFMMVLGTMLGSVYERRREIFIYNSVGLSPTNVATLFLAESAVYAIIGACVGYLLGQVISKLLSQTQMLSGMGLNYSAGSTIFVTLLTMFIVLLSTLYPMRQAFNAAIPDTHKDLDEDSETASEQDSISLFLPFVATPGTLDAMQAYMYEFLDGLQGVTVGQLAIDNLRSYTEIKDGHEVPVLGFRAWLAPFDLGISHDAELRIIYRSENGVYQYHLTARHYSGDQQNWHRLTPRFILTLRKQLLMWRILSGEQHHNYANQAKTLFPKNA